MRRKLAEHIGGILTVALVVGLLIAWYQSHQATQRASRLAAVEPYLSLRFLDFGNPLHRAIFKETLNAFRPDSAQANDSLLQAIDSYREALFTDPTLKVGGTEWGLTGETLARLSGMYGTFIIVYTVVLLLTLYAAQTGAVYRLIVTKQNRESSLRELMAILQDFRAYRARFGFVRSVGRTLAILEKALLKGCGYLILFSPAYVIGYALKTRVETNSSIFMILLGLVSNGLLITYANKLYTLLVAEGRKGYVETALAKGLSGQWTWKKHGGISPGSLIRVRKRFPSHVLDHIYMNARHQYLPTLKEQGSFLITGLIIAEMALNIQGHFGYELLQQLLYKRYDIALIMIFGIFLVVKGTEILVDWQVDRETRRYGNVD